MARPSRHPTHTGELVVRPALTDAERRWLKLLSVHPAGRARRPGSRVPWEPTTNGRALRVVDAVAAEEPIAEWAAFLAEWLAVRPGSAGRARLAGTVVVQGVSPGDRWTLRLRAGRVVVTRTTLPCPMCWDRIVRHAPLGEAHRFVHPDPSTVPPADPTFDRLGLHRPCPGDGWRPHATVRIVVWPRREPSSGTIVA